MVTRGGLAHIHVGGGMLRRVGANVLHSSQLANRVRACVGGMDWDKKRLTDPFLETRGFLRFKSCRRKGMTAAEPASTTKEQPYSSRAFQCRGSHTDSEKSTPNMTPRVKAWAPKVLFCPSCGGATAQQVPEGESELRAVCTICHKIHYQNPKMVVGCLVEHDGKLLLCKRKIEPCAGLWTLPAGYMELGESAAEGARRETWEEARAEVDIISPFAHLDIPLIGQSYVLFRARLSSPSFSPGPETLETMLFDLQALPFTSIAFSAITVALQQYVADAKAGHFGVHHGVIDKRPGASPSDPSGYVLRDHIAVRG